ncbi:MAG: dTDP-4-dehydrorhamnose 3,5-epimerase, partial [Methylomarinum sp.]|nr:dTDP-4-dehydrorhamnose 3,5-epimerase [Methylomarinum sp.]
SVTISKGAIRGLHFQYPPYTEMKIVRCLKGKIFDVAVDLRKDSSTLLKWHSEILTPDNNKMMVIPEGFAHGFQSLESESEVLYLHTAEYQAEFEGGVLFNDPKLNIQWPIEYTDISDRDRNHPLIDEYFTGLVV